MKIPPIVIAWLEAMETVHSNEMIRYRDKREPDPNGHFRHIFEMEEARFKTYQKVREILESLEES